MPCEACPHTVHRTVNGDHGRIEICRGWALGDPEYLRYVDPEGHWPDLRSLLLVEAERRVGDQVGTETRYFISSHPPRPDTCWRPRERTGGLRTACTGSWTWVVRAASLPRRTPKKGCGTAGSPAAVTASAAPPGHGHEAGVGLVALVPASSVGGPALTLPAAAGHHLVNYHCSISPSR